MPAVTRGGSSAAPRTATPRRAPAAPLAQGRQPTPSPRLDGRKLGLLCTAVAGAALAVVLATGGRGHALVAAVGRGAAGEMAHLGFRVKHVRLQGVSPFAQPDVVRAAGLDFGAPVLDLDLAAVRARVEGVGWVKSARVERLLPDTVVISAVERPRLAVWQLGGVTRVIDADGRPIPEADPGRFPDLPLVVGEGANAAVGAVLPLITARPRLASRLDALVRVDDRRWDLRLKDGGLIQLPAGGEESALIMLDSLDSRSRLLELGFARIDLRDPEMVTVRPREAPGVVNGGAGGAAARSQAAPAPAQAFQG